MQKIPNMHGLINEWLLTGIKNVANFVTALSHWHKLWLRLSCMWVMSVAAQYSSEYICSHVLVELHSTQRRPLEHTHLCKHETSKS